MDTSAYRCKKAISLIESVWGDFVVSIRKFDTLFTCTEAVWPT